MGVIGKRPKGEKQAMAELMRESFRALPIVCLVTLLLLYMITYLLASSLVRYALLDMYVLLTLCSSVRRTSLAIPLCSFSSRTTTKLRPPALRRCNP